MFNKFCIDVYIYLEQLFYIPLGSLLTSHCVFSPALHVLALMEGAWLGLCPLVGAEFASNLATTDLSLSLNLPASTGLCK